MRRQPSLGRPGQFTEQGDVGRDDQFAVPAPRPFAQPEGLAARHEQHLIRVPDHIVLADVPDEQSAVRKTDLELRREPLRTDVVADAWRLQVLDHCQRRLKNACSRRRGAHGRVPCCPRPTVSRMPPKDFDSAGERQSPTMSVAMRTVAFLAALVMLAATCMAQSTAGGSTVIEIRVYTLKSGARDRFHALLVRQSLPLLQRHGIDVVAYGPPCHDSDSYYRV